MNGPAIAGSGSQLAVAWFTAADEKEIRVTTSSNQGNSFNNPQTIDYLSVLGRVAIGCLDEDQTIVVWMAASSGGSELRATCLENGIEITNKQVLTQLPNGRQTGFPRIATYGGEAFVTWTEFEDGRPVAAAWRIRLGEESR